MERTTTTTNHNVHVYVHLDDEVVRLLRHILIKENMIMATLAELDAAVDSLVADENSLVGLLDTIHQELLDALANASDPAAIQAIADKVDAARQVIADAAARDADPNATPPAP